MRGHLVSQRWEYDPRFYAPPKYRKPCSYEAFVPDHVSEFAAPLSSGLAGVISDAEGAIRSLNDTQSPHLKPMARLLLRTESIASSKVEGLQVGARLLARSEAKAELGQKIGPEAAEVIGNINAMERAVDETSETSSVTTENIRSIHRSLLEKAPNSQIAGKIRTVQNWVGGNDHNPCGADFIPPPCGELALLLDDLNQLTNSEHLPPLLQAAIAHAQFETIHPFEDGNGRTGRALIHIILKRRGLSSSYVPPISVILARDTPKYIEGLTDFRTGDIEAWVENFATATAQAAGAAERFLQQVTELQAEWARNLNESGSVRSDAAAWAVINILAGQPVLTLPAAIALTGRSKSSTSIAIDTLVNAGILIPLGESKRNRAWEAAGLLDLVENIG